MDGCRHPPRTGEKNCPVLLIGQREQLRVGTTDNAVMPTLSLEPLAFEAFFWMTIVTLFCIVIDLGLLTLLPRLGLSFGSPVMPMLMFSSGRLVPVAAAVFLLSRLTLLSRFEVQCFAALVCLLELTLTALAIYGLYVEPFRLGVTHVRLHSRRFYPDRPLRVLQISDLHVERITSREREVVLQAQILQPDLIVLTGDYLNLDYNADPTAIRDARVVLSGLHAPLGVFAILGTAGVDRPASMAQLFDGLSIRLLDDEAVRLALPLSGLHIVGVNVRPGDAAVLESCVAALPADTYKLLLYHTPDLIETAAAVGVDLYLAGHTHAGQVRLPFFGALVTSSRYWKRYESGRHLLGKTTLYVSRGIGMEGLRMPRIRFLAPPEVVLIELG